MKPKTLKILRIVTGSLFMLSGTLTIISLIWEIKVISLVTGILYVTAGALWLASAFRMPRRFDEGDNKDEITRH